MSRYFVITIDTEGDNLWGVSDIRQKIATENAKYLFRFQELCEKYEFVPTYLTNYEMAMDQAMKELGCTGLRKKTLEIGAHEHAWNNPPYYPLIRKPAGRGKPFLGEYPRNIIMRKLDYLTKTLEDVFQTEIRSHRGGRWYLDDRIVAILEELGYLVDCTCTPGVDWSTMSGWSIGSRGTDWSEYDYKVGYYKNRIRKDEHSRLIEVPVTCVAKGKGKPAWLRPNGHNLDEMLGIVDYLDKIDAEYAEFMIHSSELMPGGSPTFERRGQIECLYEHLEVLFSEFSNKGYVGKGLTEYANMITKRGALNG